MKFKTVALIITLMWLIVGCSSSPEVQSDSVESATEETFASEAKASSALEESASNESVEQEIEAPSEPEKNDTTSIPLVDPTLPPVPTATEETSLVPSFNPKNAVFTIQDSNPEIPNDIMKEVAFFIAGGGEIVDECLYSEDPIIWEARSVYGDLSSYGDAPPVVAKLGTISIYTCDWQNGESITVTILYPDGREDTHAYIYPPTISRNVVTASTAQTYLNPITYNYMQEFFTPQPGDPTGTYEIQFEGETQTLTLAFEVVEPEEPVVLLTENAEFILYNFMPQEHVRLIAMATRCPRETNYVNSVTFCGWSEFETSSDGSLIIKTPDLFDSGYSFAIVGNESGIVYKGIRNIFRFIASSNTLLSLYNDPADVNSKFATILPEKPFEIMGSAIGSESWVQVKFSDGVTGWTKDRNIIAVDGVVPVAFESATLDNADAIRTLLETLAFIPAGTFNMGVSTGDTFGEAAEKPAHEVWLDDYWIQRTEVSNADYAKCVAAADCTEPGNLSSATRDSYYNNPDFESYPVIYISQSQAEAYCSWLGGRLPTEAE